MWTWLKLVGNFTGGRITNTQLIFVDVGIVNAVDREPPQYIVVDIDLALVMLEPKCFEEVLIDDDGAGGNDRVYHVVPDQIDHDILETGGEKGSREAKHDRAIFIPKHCIVDVRGTAEITGGERHPAHGFNKRNNVVLLDVD